jgi:hypothetical protein
MNSDDNLIALKILLLREKARIRAKLNYKKRKEAGTLKKYYVKKESRLKNIPSADELQKLKYFKPKNKTA